MYLDNLIITSVLKVSMAFCYLHNGRLGLAGLHHVSLSGCNLMAVVDVREENIMALCRCRRFVLEASESRFSRRLKHEREWTTNTLDEEAR